MSSFQSPFGFSVPSEEEVPGFRVSPQDGHPDLHRVRNGLRCNGPNSACAEFWGKKHRSPGTFRDLDNPPFRLCPQCFYKSFGRPGMGDDVRLRLPPGYPTTTASETM